MSRWARFRYEHDTGSFLVLASDSHTRGEMESGGWAEIREDLQSLYVDKRDLGAVVARLLRDRVELEFVQ